MLRPINIATTLLLLHVAIGCSAGDSTGTPRQLAFDDAFVVVAELVLAEDSVDVIAQIGSAFEMRNGDLLLGDRLRPRVRRYSPDGRLLAATGRFGAGPAEFRGVRAVIETADDRIAVTDPRLNRLSILRPDLTVDTALSLTPPTFGPLLPLGNGLLLVGLLAGRDGRLFYGIDSSGAIRWSIFDTPEALLRQPYWGSVARSLVAADSQHVFAAISLQYPIAVYDHAGDSIGVIGTPPPSFRPVPSVGRGAFIGAGAEDRIVAWLESFTVIGRLDVLRDRFLVVTHATLRSAVRERFEPEHYAIDVYDLHENRKILEDVRLPDGYHVVTGGSTLYVLVTQPPVGWTLARLDLR